MTDRVGIARECGWRKPVAADLERVFADHWVREDGSGGVSWVSPDASDEAFRAALQPGFLSHERGLDP